MIHPIDLVTWVFYGYYRFTRILVQVFGSVAAAVGVAAAEQQYIRCSIKSRRKKITRSFKKKSLVNPVPERLSSS